MRFLIDIEVENKAEATAMLAAVRAEKAGVKINSATIVSAEQV